MIYYPAPVPMMLNIPKRLSKLPSAPQMDKRRSETLGRLPSEARKSAVWLPEMPETAEAHHLSMGDDASTYSQNQKRANNRSHASSVESYDVLRIIRPPNKTLKSKASPQYRPSTAFWTRQLSHP